MDAVEAEATGQAAIVATYLGHDYKLPTDADTWPLALVAASVGVSRDKLMVDYATTARALAVLLGDQWPGFLRAFPKRRHLEPASTAFAAAAGFTPPAPQDRAFGPLPRLLAMLQLWPTAVEATLAAAGFDYRDRWRHDDDGRPRLTLRQIFVHLACAPIDSAVAIAQNDGRPPFTATDLVLMDVFEAIARTAHPARPLTPEQRKGRESTQTKRAKAIDDYYRRHPNAATRKKTAVETARANARPNRREAPTDDAQDETSGSNR